MSDTIKLGESWKPLLLEEFQKDYFRDLKKFLLQEKAAGQIIYPPGDKIFAALDTTPFEQLKVVIIGQDPYHGVGQANGLCFSVNDGIPQPPSLQNIFKELKDDCGFTIPVSGNLKKWASHGVLLLNATLTVRKDQPGSHQKRGWEIFTDTIIKKISEDKEHIVFILWGKFAQSKEPLIDQHKHLILKAAHPSPFSAYNGFFGCKHFSKTNAYLKEHGMEEIDWQV